MALLPIRRMVRCGAVSNWTGVLLLCLTIVATSYFVSRFRHANPLDLSGLDSGTKSKVSSSLPNENLVLPRSWQMARRKQASLETYNGKMPLEELLAFFRTHTGKQISEDAYTRLDELMLSQVVEKLWRESSSRSSGLMVMHRAMSEALQESFPHQTLTNADVILFPDDSALRSIIAEPGSDFFRDTGRHWKWIAEFAESLGQEPISKYKELDAYAAEELSEFVSVLAVGVVESAVAKSESDRIEVDHVSAAFESFGRYSPDVVLPRKSEVSFNETTKNELLAKLPAPMFRDMTSETEITFFHKPNSENQQRRLNLAVPLGIAGGGVSAGDFDGDGRQDLYFAGDKGGALFRNFGSGKFEDVSASVGLPDAGETRAGYFIDFDNDGDQDLFMTFVGLPNRLLQNDGGEFTDISIETGFLQENRITHEAVWFDMNNDGLLDVYVANFGDWYGGQSPTLGRVNTNAPPNRLYRHELVDGKHRFIEIGAELNVDDRGWTHCVGVCDIDQDGWQDLFSINDFGTSFVYRNVEGERFEEVSRELHLDNIYNGMSFSLLDLNHDSNFSIYISQIMKLTHRQRYTRPTEQTLISFDITKKDNMRILVNNRLFSKAYQKRFRDDHNYLIEPADFGWAWDASGFDYDNDSDQDLIVLNGTESATPAQDGNREVEFLSKFSFARNVCMIQEDGYFYDASDGNPLAFFGNSRGTTFLDIDADGDLDVVVSNYNGRPKVFENLQQSGHSWVRLKLTGTQSNRDAIGATVQVKFANQSRYGVVVSGSGFLSQKPYELHFGLGTATTIDSVVINWPSGKVQELNELQINQRHEITEP